ncbi:arabinan endo-1,5-alpha-L-arabinosidase [Granulicella sibirica]|uniref:Arabinan endo-1,5-alpha-L-arabinosidase n=1 Tax=Granulicella sibirica TaxID=2479048 RepID=A0A4Q0SWG9_9BACT|nr:arabinan endo-1,5-alpha-L-arabinosidase [Granulicella sibirica]RXH54772.1 Arabinan endo-1,5-alpha-L-arabinosidase [Granulicella sibirica]
MAKRWLAAVLALGVLMSGTACRAEDPHVYALTGDAAGTHDPSIIKEGGTWYVFATGKAPGGGQFAVRCSTDLEKWTRCGQVFDAIPGWIHEKSPGTEELWAPDISYGNGEYRMYYAYSLFGKNTSGIALAVNKTLDSKSPEYKWVDKGLVLESKAEDNFNAIDPNFIRDEKGRGWLAFGSFWDGIKMRRLDDATGLVSKEDGTVYALARRAMPPGAAPAPPGLPPDWEAVEAPFIVRHGGYFYLFTSWDLCCRGLKSTYRTMVGRSKVVTGPYVDEAGKALAEGGGTQILFPNAKWLGPGGESVLMDPKGKDLLVYHAYDAKTGKPSLQISTIDWAGGWPKVGLEK